MTRGRWAIDIATGILTFALAVFPLGAVVTLGLDARASEFVLTALLVVFVAGVVVSAGFHLRGLARLLREAAQQGWSVWQLAFVGVLLLWLVS
jgi:hypothetical protein